MTLLGIPAQALFGQLLIGLINGAFYAMLSLGLSVIFGLLNIINFAHGAQYMMGAFVAYFLLQWVGLGYWWALLVAPLVVGVIGAVLERTMLKRLYALDHLYGLLLTFGLALVIQGLFRNQFGSSGLPYQIPAALTGGRNLGFMTGAGAAPLLSVESITMRFGAIHALSDVSVDIHRGEIVAIIGPNGAGKTTLLNAVSGFYHPQEGRILFQGKDRTHLKPFDVAALGIARTFQNVALFKGMLVQEIFEIVSRLNREEGVSVLLAEQNASIALRFADYAYVMENGRVVLDGDRKTISENEDIKEFYLGLSGVGQRKSYRDVKHYKRRKRWLS